MSDIFQVEIVRDIAQEIATSLLSDINREAQRRAAMHRDSFCAFWYSTEATPQQLVAKMGTSATLFFQIAQANVEHIATVAALSGKQLSDFLQPSEYIPPKTITYNPDGTVTINDTVTIGG
jgi:hypothetical protein